MTRKSKVSLRSLIPRLARKHGTPLFLISKSRLLEQVKRFKTFLPRVTPYYAAKANSHPLVLDTLVKEGLSFDVASVAEIGQILKLGVPADRMIFANTIKRVEALKFAARNKVRLMTFDTEYELIKIARYAPDARVMLRIKVPNVGSIVELSIKFGAEPADAQSLLMKARQLGLKPVGISFHVGSQCLNIENYLNALESAAIIFKDAKLKQLPLEILNIGGGFPIRHFENEKDLFSTMGPRIQREIDRLFNSDVRVMAEPGRSLVGPACILVMSVIGKSIRSNKHWYYLDDGVYGSLSGIVFDHCIYQYKVFRRGYAQITTLAGPTCDGFDVISISESLPELDFGDLVYVENIGAYSWATTTNFNGIPPAQVIGIP